MQKLIYLTVLIFSLVAAAGCNTTSPDAGTALDIRIDLLFQNEKGENLLNPNHPNAITEQNTDLYFQIEGQNQKVFDGNLDCPKMFCIQELEDDAPYKYLMLLTPNIIEGQNMATTYIRFSDATMDTLRVAYEYNTPATYVTKIWYNQELRWSLDENGEDNPLRFLIITKEFGSN